MNEGLYTLLGVIIGFTGTWWINRQDRMGRLLSTIADDRFRVSQEAYQLSVKLREVIHRPDEERIAVTTEARDWFNLKNLYLPPDIRNDFNQIITRVHLYQDIRAELYRLKKEGSKEQTDQQRAELTRVYREIMELGKRIQASMDIYYALEKPFKFKNPFNRKKAS